MYDDLIFSSSASSSVAWMAVGWITRTMVIRQGGFLIVDDASDPGTQHLRLSPSSVCQWWIVRGWRGQMPLWISSIHPRPMSGICISRLRTAERLQQAGCLPCDYHDGWRSAHAVSKFLQLRNRNERPRLEAPKAGKSNDLLRGPPAVYQH